MPYTVITNARIVNEGSITTSDIRIAADRIDLIAPQITPAATDTVVDAAGKYLLPGLIDDQVHFRQPGLTHKATIGSESRAAVAGGVTSFMEMPNVNPTTTTLAELENKYDIARRDSYANYSFYLGATEDNLEVIKALDPASVCGVKIFMGASTGSLLVENTTALDNIFAESPVLVATHCESGAVMAANSQTLGKPRDELTIADHPVIRDDNACFASSQYAVELAKKHGTNLHVLHITTEKELALFTAGDIAGKHITAEACVHHLWFSQQDYAQQGNLIKCNPAIKSITDRDAVRQALIDDRIDIIATDHAPHTWEEKQVPYPDAPAGLPLIQHSLLSLMAHVDQGWLPIEKLVQKACHNPATRYRIAQRGFIREGYFADLVLVDPEQMTTATHADSLYHCQWTPFDQVIFPARISSTWVNGELVFDGHRVLDKAGVGHRFGTSV